ncbi:hypothetical protein ABZV60_19435 [Streptomyces sp. NPDC004787]|uniref:hypothetical protein n=1 Tax=Streptomyces sp. NPDC004787 TaxID=3154291 RepID=UPI0033AA4C81
MNADDIRANLTTKVERINGQRNITPAAKRTMLARAYIEARDALDKLRQQETDNVIRERQKLERKLFGTSGFSPDPQMLVAKRDADDRAAKYESPADAIKAMERAERDGDSILAKAIASRAADWGGDPNWAGVVHRYVADKPTEAETLKAMQELPNTDDPMFKLSQAMRYGVAAPRELGDSLHPHQLDAIASQPLDGDAAA